MRRVVSWVLVVLLVVVPLAGVCVFSWVQARDPEALAPKPVAVLQQPTVVSDDGSVEATITALLDPGARVTAPAWQGGVVTRVDVKPGDAVSTGSVLLAVDGVGRVAVASPAPFYRSLAVGDSGGDVLDLERALKAMGDFAGEPDRSFTKVTANAVDRLGKRLGAGDASGVFDPSWVVWLPGENLVAQSVGVAVNDPAPSQGSVVFSTAPSVSSVSLSGPAGPVDFSSGAYVLSQNGVDVATVRSDGDVDAGLLARLTAQDDGSGASGGSSSGGASVSSRVYGVSLRRETAVTLLSVPASAVMTGSDGTATCVYGKYGLGDARYQARAVRVAGGSMGVTRLEPDDDLKTFYVLADPLAVMGEAPTCR